MNNRNWVYMTFANTAASLRPEVNAPENVEVVPTGAALGAEIRGVDLSQPVPEATKEIMRRAWADHLVLLWRGQNLPDLSFLEAAGIFGVTREPAARKYQVAGGYKIGGKRVPFLRWFATTFTVAPERLLVVSRGGTASW